MGDRFTADVTCAHCGALRKGYIYMDCLPNTFRCGVCGGKNKVILHCSLRSAKA